MQIKTMSINETVKRLRELGIKTSAYKVGDAIEQGVYPFGICIKGENTRRRFEIYEADFNKWVSEKADG